MLRLIRWTSIAMIVALAVGWGAVWQAQRAPEGAVAGLVRRADAVVTGRAEGQIPSGSLVGGPFTLTNTDGKTVTDADFRGRWMLVYFGYTYCPDICPTELQTIVAALDELGPEAAKIVPIFITVDPGRDTVQAMKQYVGLFDPRLIGLTGTQAQIADVTLKYRVYHKAVAAATGRDYLVDHSSLVYLVDPTGGFVRLFSADTSSNAMAAGIALEVGQQRQKGAL